jgi:hypothetical protein
VNADDFAAVPQREMENRRFTEADERLRIAANCSDIDSIGDSVRALSTARREDPADCRVAQGVVEIRGAMLVSAGKKPHLLEHVFSEIDLQAPTLDDSRESID